MSKFSGCCLAELALAEMSMSPFKRDRFRDRRKSERPPDPNNREFREDEVVFSNAPRSLLEQLSREQGVVVFC